MWIVATWYIQVPQQSPVRYEGLHRDRLHWLLRELLQDYTIDFKEFWLVGPSFFSALSNVTIT